MQGEQKQQITITDRGTIELTLNGDTRTAGVYLYALIADGVMVDTKRMILTD